MNIWLKIRGLRKRTLALLCVGACTVLLVAIALVLPAYVSSPTFARTLQQQLASATGRQVELDRVSLRLLPVLGFTVQGVRIADDPAYGTDETLVIGSMRVDVDMWALMGAEVRFKSVDINGVQLRVILDERGSNLASLLDSLESRQEQETVEAEEEKVDFFSLRGLKVVKGSCVFENRLTRRVHIVEQVRAEFEAESGDFSMECAVRNQGDNIAILSGKIAASGRLLQDESRSMLNTRLASLDFSGSFQDMHRKARPIRFQTQGMASFDAREWHGTASLAPFSLQAGALNLKGNVEVSGIGEELNVTGNLEALTPDLTMTLASMNLPAFKGAEGAFRNVNASLSFTLANKCLSIPEWMIKGSNSTLSGSFTVRDFAKPEYEFDVKATYWDSAWFEGLEGMDGGMTRAVEHGTGGQPGAMPGRKKDLLDVLRTLQVDGAVHVDTLRIDDIVTRDVSIHLILKDGILENKEFAASFDKGRLQGQLSGNFQKDAVTLDARLDIYGLREGKMPAKDELSTRLLVRKNLKIRGTNEKYSGELSIPEFNARDLFWTFGVTPSETVRWASLRKVSLTVAFTGSREQVEVTRGRLQLQQVRADITGSASLNKPAITASVKMNELNLFHFLSKPGINGNGNGAKRFQLAAFRPWDFDLKLTADTFRVDDIAGKAFSCSVRMKNGQLTVDPLTAVAWGGTVRLTTFADFRGNSLKASAAYELKGVDSRKIAALFIPDTVCSGLATLKGTLKGEGTTPELFFRSLTGDAGIAAKSLLLGDKQDVMVTGLAATAGITQQAKGRYSLTFAAQAAPSFASSGRISALDIEGGALVAVADGSVVSVERGMVKGAVSLVEKRPIGVNAAFGYMRKGKVLQIDSLRLDAGDMVATIRGRAGFGGEYPDVEAQLSTGGFTPRRVLPYFLDSVPEFRNPDVMRSARISTRFTMKDNGLVWDSIDAMLDGETVEGTLSRTARQRWVADIKASVINIGKYKLKREPEGKTSEPSELPVEFFASTKSRAKIAVRQLVIEDVAAGKADIDVESAKGKWDVHLVSPMFYGGRLKIDGSIIAAAPSADSKGALRMAASVDANGFRCGSLLLDVAGKDYVSGKSNLRGQVAFTGLNSDALLESMSGRTSVSIQKGSFDFVKPERVDAKDRSSMAKAQNAQGRTVFNKASMTTTIRNGGHCHKRPEGCEFGFFSRLKVPGGWISPMNSLICC